MNKNAIQRFAIWARKELIAQVSQRAYQYDITEEDCGDYNAVAVGGRVLTDEEKRQRQELIVQIRKKDYKQVMEEVAYTWFNRFIALRFMEVNNYLPTHIRVFSDAFGAFKPEILNNALHLDLSGLDMEKVADLIEKNQTEDLYRYLLLTQCNALSTSLPRMFEKMGSYTELLLPNNILRQDGILGRMVADIPEEDWTDQVQIIGWLYQYYNTELKDETFALLKKNIKITKERIPSATQLFTPDWIVRYMVENSLGRLWIEGHPDDELKAGWKYYLDEAEQEPEVQAQLEEIQAEYRTLRPQDIKVIDPCMGSGHILVYAFDVLIQIYKKAGFSERDAAQSILENNLYGLDIDDRATQLAYFAVMMKARQYDRRIFSRNIQPHVYAIMESNDIQIPAMWRLGSETEIAEKLIAELKDAKEYGSILNLSLTLDELTSLCRRLMEMKETFSEGDLLDRMESAEIVDGLLPLVEIAEVLVQKYEVAVTNPPYMAVSNASANVQDYVKKQFPDSKSDLFAVFIERCCMFACKNGFQAMITQHAWMFLSSFEKLRTKLQTVDTVNMVHLGARAFEEIGGEVVQTTSFVLRQNSIKDYQGTYCRLIEPTTQQEKEAMFLANENRYMAKQSNFSKIPGSPVAYWVNEKICALFKEKKLETFFDIKAGICTGENAVYILFWHEVDYTRTSMFSPNAYMYSAHNKGGEYRKWYGNRELVLKYNREALNAMAKNEGFRHDGKEYYFRSHIGWSKITSGNSSFRYYEEGFTFDSAGLGLFSKGNQPVFEILALLNSCVSDVLISFLNPTLNVTPMVVKNLPFPRVSDDMNVNSIVSDNIDISRVDWDSFETSWDFQMHPIVKKALSCFRLNNDEAVTIEHIYEFVAQDFEDRFQKLKANEEKLNRIFIDIYRLRDQLTPEVDDNDVTVRRADLGRDIRSLISYAVGCMFGRYSLDISGLAYAGGEWDDSKYKSFIPDPDSIIPICDDDYFDDDITGRFAKWMEIIFGKDTLEENLRFIADTLGGKGSSREVIRSYFLNDFYADHLKIYQKRPIYWLFDSGKKNGFKALIYMHRYQSDLLARMRTDYVHEQQERYRTQLKHLEDAVNTASASERVKLVKQQKKFQEQALELQKYEEKIHHLADQNIKIDLDDGVIHNYALFADVLAKRR